MACLCAAGGARPARRERVDRLAARIRSGEAFTATLCGARIEAGCEVRILRDPGQLRRRGAGGLALEQGVEAVWDGRFVVASDLPDVVVRPLQGLAARLSGRERRASRAFPPAARAALPAFQNGENVTCPILAEGTWASARALASDRLAGACGRIARENDLSRGSDGDWTNGALS
jgi:tRNA(Ile)-lysidine synthase